MSDPVSFSAFRWQAGSLPGKIEEINSTLSRVPASAPANQARNPEADSRLREACAELEALFISYLFKEMRATVPKSEFISGGKAEELYTSMLDNQVAVVYHRFERVVLDA